MHKYRLIAKKGEGTFSEVLKAQSIKNGKYFAIKCMKNHFDSIEQVNNLREIQALRRLSPNPGVIKLYEVLYDQPTGRLALVFELMDMNIYELIRGRRHYVAEERVQNYMYQLTRSMDHMHRNGIFHRDVKPENILIMDKVLKVADFGSCRGIYSKQPYTEYISTRWYRAPECLLTDGYYGYKMDMWGLGCVMFEVIALFPLFPGTNELDQIQKIHNVMGTPPAEVLDKFKRYSSGHIDFNFPQQEGTGIARMIPHASKECIDLIQKLLLYDPEERLSARLALRHPYFRNLREAEKRAQAAREAQQASASVGADASGGGGGGGGGSAGSGGVTNRAAKVARSHGHRTSRQDGLQMPVPPPGGSGALPPMAGGPPGAGASVGTGAPGAAYGGSVGAGGAGGQPTARFPQQHAVQEQIQDNTGSSLPPIGQQSLLHSLKIDQGQQQQQQQQSQSGQYKFKTHRFDKSNKGFGMKNSYGANVLGSGVKGGFSKGSGMMLPSKGGASHSKQSVGAGGNFSVRSHHGLGKPAAMGAMAGSGARGTSKYLSPYSQKYMKTQR